MSTHCCEMMRANVESVCQDHSHRQDCPDCLIDYRPASDVYGIMIHDGGSSMIEIGYCPWCGTELSKGDGK